MSIYQLKPKFQSLLRPLVGTLNGLGVTANQVTVFTAVVSALVGVLVYLLALKHPILWFVLPLWLLLRMALNAIDGMLAREFGHASDLGAVLNESTDVLSDAFIFLPFLLIAPLWWLVLACALLAALSEMIGLHIYALGGERRYDGPMGKSDRAFLLSCCAILIGFMQASSELTHQILYVVFVVMTALLLKTIYNRLNNGLNQLHNSGQ